MGTNVSSSRESVLKILRVMGCADAVRYEAARRGETTTIKLSIYVLTDASPQQPSLVATLDLFQIEPPRTFQPAELFWLFQLWPHPEPNWYNVFLSSLLEYRNRMGPGGQHGGA